MAGRARALKEQIVLQCQVATAGPAEQSMGETGENSVHLPQFALGARLEVIDDKLRTSQDFRRVKLPGCNELTSMNLEMPRRIPALASPLRGKRFSAAASRKLEKALYNWSLGSSYFARITSISSAVATSE